MCIRDRVVPVSSWLLVQMLNHYKATGTHLKESFRNQKTMFKPSSFYLPNLQLDQIKPTLHRKHSFHSWLKWSFNVVAITGFCFQKDNHQELCKSQRVLSFSSDNALRDVHNSSCHAKARYNKFFYYSFTDLPILTILP